MEKWKEKIIDNLEVVLRVGMAIIALGIIVGMISCVVCAEVNRPSEGIVVKKRYVPAHTETEWKKVKGKEDTKVPVSIYQDAEYIVTIRGINKKEKEVEYSFYVTPEEYDRIEIGEWYVLEKK